MSGNLPYILFVLIAGSGLPLQAMINGRLGQAVGSPVWAAAISFSVGTLALLAYLGLMRLAGTTMVPGPAAFSQTAWWMWAGGLIGAVFVTASAASVHALGAAVLVAVVVAGQMFASILLDHFGVISGVAQAMTWQRLLGAVLIIAGVVLIQRY